MNELYPTIKRLLMVGLSSITASLALNYFLIPAAVLSSGLSGIAQIVQQLLRNFLGAESNVGALILILNLPIFLLGFLKLGKAATVWSFITVVVNALAIGWFPHGQVTTDVLMNALVGGLLMGVSGGVTLKLGFTTGGLDILSLVMAKVTGKSVGNFVLLLNGGIVLVAGFIYSWESALYTLISIFVMSQVIDVIHNGQQKVTVFIITNKGSELVNTLRETIVRGVTHWPSRGGFSGADRETIMVVATRYELFEIRRKVAETDPEAFVDIVATQGVVGKFASEEEQQVYSGRR